MCTGQTRISQIDNQKDTVHRNDQDSYAGDIPRSMTKLAGRT